MLQFLFSRKKNIYLSSMCVHTITGAPDELKTVYEKIGYREDNLAPFNTKTIFHLQKKCK